MEGTSADGFIPALEGLEVGSQLFELGLAPFGGDDLLLVEDDGFGPLHRVDLTSVIFYSSSVSFFPSNVCSASIFNQYQSDPFNINRTTISTQ
jgi:hypothetical protein